MILSTTGSIEGKKIVEYRGLVFGEVISGVDFIKDFAAGMRNFFGGRSETYEKEYIAARNSALNEMCQNAANMGANAIIGIKVDYEVIGPNGGMLMACASGTAVIVD